MTFAQSINKRKLARKHNISRPTSYTPLSYGNSRIKTTLYSLNYNNGVTSVYNKLLDTIYPIKLNKFHFEIYDSYINVYGVTDSNWIFYSIPPKMKKQRGSRILHFSHLDSVTSLPIDDFDSIYYLDEGCYKGVKGAKITLLYYHSRAKKFVRPKPMSDSLIYSDYYNLGYFVKRIESDSSNTIEYRDFNSGRLRSEIIFDSIVNYPFTSVPVSVVLVGNELLSYDFNNHEVAHENFYAYEVSPFYKMLFLIFNDKICTGGLAKNCFNFESKDYSIEYELCGDAERVIITNETGEVIELEAFSESKFEDL